MFPCTGSGKADTNSTGALLCVYRMLATYRSAVTPRGLLMAIGLEYCAEPVTFIRYVLSKSP